MKEKLPDQVFKIMPTRPVSADKMSIGGASGGKHWTRAEVESRQQATASRERRVTLKPPDWLNEEALKVWKDIKKKLKGIDLLDNLDTDLLAIYCDAIVHYRESSQKMARPEEDANIDELAKTTQAWARIVTSTADKLGLTPGGRARLAKKKAEKIVDHFADSFGG
jgi:P27 family predicted phage terminase small subunit